MNNGYKKRKIVFFGFLVVGFSLFLSNTASAQENNSILYEGVETENPSSEELQNEHPPVPDGFFRIPDLISTASVSTTTGSELYQAPAANLSNTLYGRLLGFWTMQGSGEPGRDAASALQIRGIGTLNYRDIAIFVDGFQTDYSYVQYLSPAEIESISVLKDAAALTPFGMKGSNGVLWITTIRGQISSPQVQLRTRTGIQQPVHINKPLGSYDYARLYNEAVSNDAGMVWTPAYTSEQLEAFRNGRGVDVDWHDEVLRDVAPWYDANITFRGGDSNVRYFGLLGYMDNRGIYDVSTTDERSNANHERINIRTNVDFDLFDIFEGKISVGGRIEDRKYPNFNSTDLWRNLARYPSNIYPVRNEDETWTGTAVFPDNPRASITELGWTSNHDRYLQASVRLRERLDIITEGLYFSQGISFNNWMRGTYNQTKNYARIINDMRQTTDENTVFSIFDDNLTNQWDWKQFTSGVGYERQFGRHSLTATAEWWHSVYEVDESMNAEAGIHTTYANQNIGGRVHYSFDERYATEFGFSYSGSDNYAKGNRWGFYPALSVAWIVSNESFFPDNSFIDYLKIRASAGQTGNDHFEGRRYLYQGYFIGSGGFNTGPGDPIWRPGLIQPYVPNPDLFAELSTKYNIGIETRLFENLEISLDAFLDKRTDIIAQNFSLSALFGANPPFQNLGEVTNKGMEASLYYNNRLGSLEYFFGGLASLSKNQIDYMAEVIPVPSAARTGHPIGTPFGLEAIGFYDIDDFNQDGSLREDLPVPAFGQVQPGDIKYRDINGDRHIDEHDEGRIGDPWLPKLMYSFFAGAEIRGFDVKLFFQGAVGRSVNLLWAWDQTVAFIDDGNVFGLAEGRWAYYPDQGIDTRGEATYPRLTTEGNPNNYRNSTFWMRDGSFLRLRNAEIGYTLPSTLANSIGISNLRIFVSAMNLITWSPLMRDYDIDPETMSGYPAMKSATGGIAIDF